MGCGSSGGNARDPIVKAEERGIQKSTTVVDMKSNFLKDYELQTKLATGIQL